MKRTLHRNSIRAHMRNRAKGVVFFIVEAIEKLDTDALYPEEIIALETVCKISSGLRKNWKKEIPKEKK
jgi:hypothetical protein